MVKILGAWIDNDNGWETEWAQIKRIDWGQYWANNKQCCNLSLKHQLRLLSRCNLTSILYRCSRWCFTHSRGQRIDRLQTWMVARLSNTHSLAADGTVDTSHWRHVTHAAWFVCRKNGLWSMRVCERIVEWNEHICRHKNTFLYRIMKYHNEAWLVKARTWASTCANETSLAGRLATRVTIGHVQPRYEPGVAVAKSLLSARPAVEPETMHAIADIQNN